MIHDLKPYPRMKDSGVPWLGEVPEHWKVRKLKYAVSFSGGGTPSKAEASFWGGRIPWVSPKDMTRARIADSIDHITEEAVTTSATSLVLPGALLMVVRSGILRRSIPVAINAVEVALNQDMKALRPRDDVVASDYLRALVQGNEAALIQEWTKQGATVESIEHEFLANSLVPLPPLPEQAAIVRFIDHFDRKTRRYIRAKQKLIKLLEEQKQVIIHRAVTRGLDPNVRLKSSGVEWLGDVPEHWDLRPAKWFFREVDQRSTSGDKELLSVSHLTGVTPRSEKKITMFMAESYMGHKLCCAGDLVINTMWAWMGALGISRQTGIVSPAYGVYRQYSDAQLLVDYADLLLRTRPYITEYICRSTGIQSSRLRLYPEQFLRIPILCPPWDEQLEIIAHLNIETAELSRATALAHREIDLLLEYRTRLVAVVVTGKLDVREAAAQLPVEDQENQQLDEFENIIDAEDDALDNLDEALEDAVT